MAFDSFLKIDTIRGESQDKAHKDEIEILSFHWGVTQTGTWGKGTGGGGGKCNHDNFSFVKRIDKASIPLFKKCCTGEHIPSALFTVRKAGGDKVEYLTYKFTDLMITSVRPGGASQGPDEIPLEEVSIGYGKCELKYIPQTAQGGGTGPVTGGWDLMENVPV
jgi:type VI secretion system secreted protein Hcp